MKFFLAGLSLLGVPFLVQAAGGSGSAQLELSAVIEPSLVVQISPSVSGLLAETLVDRGDIVTEGQVLALLDLGVERAHHELTVARAEFDSAVRIAELDATHAADRLDRREALNADGIESRESVDELRMALARAELALQKAGEDRLVAELERLRSLATLEQGTIRSPLAGVVAERFLSRGELVNRSDAAVIFEVVQLDPLHVEVHVPVALYGSVVPGTRAQVRVHGPFDATFPAEVSVVDRVFDTASESFAVQLVLPNPDYVLPAGLPCRVQFELQGK